MKRILGRTSFVLILGLLMIALMAAECPKTQPAVTCNTFKTPETCGAANCQWVNDGCEKKVERTGCAVHQEQPSCIADTQCEWAPAGGCQEKFVATSCADFNKEDDEILRAQRCETSALGCSYMQNAKKCVLGADCSAFSDSTESDCVNTKLSLECAFASGKCEKSVLTATDACRFTVQCSKYTTDSNAIWEARRDACNGTKVGSFQMCEWTSNWVNGGVCSDRSVSPDPCKNATEPQCGAQGDYANCGLRTPVGKTDGNAIAVGENFLCQIDNQGSISCEKKPGTFSNAANDPSIPPEDRSNFKQIAVSNNHACGLKNTGNVVCWGLGLGGRLDSPEAIYLSIAAGYQFTCGLTDQKAIKCWGPLLSGDFVGPGTGNGDAFGIASISPLSRGACALLQERSVGCWGNFFVGGSEEAIQAPTSTGTGNKTVAIAVTYGCVVNNSGFLTCFGPYAPKNLATINNSLHLLDSSGIQKISLDSSTNGTPTGCALMNNGTIGCWGPDALQQVPTPNENYIDVSVGGWKTCAIKKNGARVCWNEQP